MMPLRITRHTLEKAEKYAKLANDCYKSECYGWLLTPRGARDTVVRDAMLADDQQVSYTHCEVSGEGVIKSNSEALRNGYQIVGWWHSHVDFEPFQSETDQENTRRLLNVIRFRLNTTVKEEKPLLQGNLETVVNNEGILIREKEGTISVYVAVNGPFLIDNGTKIDNVRLVTSKKVGFCYSLTVNAKKEKPSAQVALYHENGLSGVMNLEDTTLEILDSDDLLEKEVRKKLHHER